MRAWLTDSGRKQLTRDLVFYMGEIRSHLKARHRFATADQKRLRRVARIRYAARLVRELRSVIEKLSPPSRTN